MKKLLVSPVLFIAIAIIAQTICNYLSPPYPTNLTSSKSGNTIAWVFNDKGSRNIYTASADGNNVTRITNFSGDIFIAFTSANPFAFRRSSFTKVETLSKDEINPLFETIIQATDEAISNAMVAAETMEGINGNRS